MRRLPRPSSSPRYDPGGSREALARLRRHCIAGASVALGAFGAAFVTDLVRGVSSDNMAVVGIEMFSAAAGVVCGMAAVLSWMLPMAVQARQAEDLVWAADLGQDLAEARRRPMSG